MRHVLFVHQDSDHCNSVDILHNTIWTKSDSASATTTMPPQGRVTRGALAQAEDFASLSSRDRLIFAQAVYEHGARQSSWAEISKVLSKHPLISKPKNFATVQSCAAIYNYLMSEAELERCVVYRACSLGRALNSGIGRICARQSRVGHGCS